MCGAKVQFRARVTKKPKALSAAVGKEALLSQRDATSILSDSGITISKPQYAIVTPPNPWIYKTDDLCTMSEYQVGQVVQLADGQLATIRFVGQTGFATGDWIGVELESLNGKNDGSIKGERYFDCEMGRGMFLRAAAVAAIIEQPAAAPKSAAPAKKAARPNSVVSSGLGRRTSIVPDSGVGKRMSMNAASPSPAARGSRPSSMLRVSLTSGRPVSSSLTSYSLPRSLLRNNSQPLHRLPQPHEPVPRPTFEHRLLHYPRQQGQVSEEAELPWDRRLYRDHAYQGNLWQEGWVLGTGLRLHQPEQQAADPLWPQNQDFDLAQNE